MHAGNIAGRHALGDFPALAGANRNWLAFQRWIVSAAKPGEDGKAVILGLRSLSDRTERVGIEPASSKARLFLSSAGEERGRGVTGPIEIPFLGAATVRMEL